MKIEIDKKIFEEYPGYCRAVVVVSDADNMGDDADLFQMLKEAEDQIRKNPAMKDHRAVPGISAWREVFRSLGLNPNKYPPSIDNLIKRTMKGKDLPFINKLVCIFNIISLKYVIPCGGDDIDNVTGDLKLSYASGEETYVPLGQPDVVEHPGEGEVIYFEDSSKDVFCRAWCWKNGDRSKIMPETKNVVINLEGMPPMSSDVLLKVSEELSDMVSKHCRGGAVVHLLTENSPFVEVDGKTP